MEKSKFNKLEIDDQIQYINNNIIGSSLTKICKKLGISRSTIGKRFNKYGFVFNKELNQYVMDVIDEGNNTMKDVSNGITEVVVKNTNVVSKNTNVIEQEMVVYFAENFKEFKEMLERYKSTTRTTTETTTQGRSFIFIELQDDRDLSPKPKSIRINEYVYREWLGFCEENKHFSKRDLISQALKEFMEKYSL